MSALVLALPVGARGQEAATTLDDEETSLESAFRYDGWFDAGFSYFYDPAAEVPTCGPTPAADGAATTDVTSEAGLPIGEAICLDGFTAAADGSGEVEASVVADSYTTADATSFDQTSAEALAYEEWLAEPLPLEEATADVSVLD